MGAHFSRGEARDYLDIDRIRQSGRFSDAELLELAAGHDPGFDIARFAEQLDRVRRLHPRQVGQYGITADQLVELQRRLISWAQQLTEGQESQ